MTFFYKVLNLIRIFRKIEMPGLTKINLQKLGLSLDSVCKAMNVKVCLKNLHIKTISKPEWVVVATCKKYNILKIIRRPIIKERWVIKI